MGGHRLHKQDPSQKSFSSCVVLILFLTCVVLKSVLRSCRRPQSRPRRLPLTKPLRRRPLKPTPKMLLKRRRTRRNLAKRPRPRKPKPRNPSPKRKRNLKNQPHPHHQQCTKKTLRKRSCTSTNSTEPPQFPRSAPPV